MAAEEEGLDLLRLAVVVHERLVDLRRLLEVVAGGGHLPEAALVGLDLEPAAVAVDRGQEGELEPEPDEQVAEHVDRRRPCPSRRRPSASALDTSEDHRGGHGGDREADLLVVGAALVAQHVAVLDVGHLVAEHGRELVLVLHAGEQARVDVDRAVRVGEGVEGRVLDHPHPVADGRVGGHAGRVEPRDDPFEIGLQERVLVEPDVLEELLLLVAGLLPERLLVGQRLEGARPGSRSAAAASRRRTR